MKKINKIDHAWVWAVAAGNKHGVKTLRDLKAFFTEYEWSTSDDTDSIEVAYTGGWIETHEGECVEELWDSVRLPPAGESFAVRVFHDCPGCCRSSAFKALMFIVKS